MERSASAGANREWRGRGRSPPAERGGCLHRDRAKKPLRALQGTQCQIKACGILRGSIAKAAQRQGDILTAEAEAVAEDVVDAFFAGHVGNVVEVAIRVGGLVIDGRRQ